MSSKGYGAVAGPALPPGFKQENYSDDSDSDDIGPALPPGYKKDGDSGSIGPALPPGYKKNGDCGSIGPALPPGYKKDHREKDSNIGPQLPPHMIKDNRDIGPELPKTHRNPSASIGPSLPSGMLKQDSVKHSDIGPALPPGYGRPEEDDEDDDDDIGPALPPGFKKDTSPRRYAVGPALPSRSSYGPALPPGMAPAEESDEDDDVIGPMPSSGPMKVLSASEEFEKRAEKMKNKLLGLDEPEIEVTERETWMLELPAENNKNFGLGPRKFRTKAPTTGGDRSGWTDTPQDRERKEMEAAKGGAVKKTHVDDEPEGPSERDKQMAEQIEKFREARGKDSLLDRHTKKLKKKEKEEGSQEPKKRKAFSREDDLNTNKFDEAQKKSIIKKSRQLDSRFSHGSSSFL